MAEDTADKDAVLKALQECQQTLSELKTREDILEHAEGAFGRLAERVDTVLEERRVSPDRRAVQRSSNDRRRNRRSAA